MKYLFVLCCVLAAVVCEEKYTDKYDNTNIQEFIENPRLMKASGDCLLDRGKCTAALKELKENLGDALATGCSKCTKAQEEGATKLIDHLIKHNLPLWNELVAKYDPEGKWRKKYEDRARANGIVIPQ